MKPISCSIVFLCLLLIASCNTQPGNVDFPFEETEFKKPKTVKATPTYKQIPDSLPNAKYTMDKGALVLRDQNIPLEKPMVTKAGKPSVTENTLGKSVPATPTIRKAGIPDTVEARGKIVLARGKVIKAGQPASYPYVPPAISDQDNFGIKYLSQGQNLPGASIRTILEDSQGRIWIGSFKGLAVLEGGEIKVFTTAHGLSHNSISSLMESSDGAIWIGTDGGGVNVYESGMFTWFGTEEGLDIKHVTSIFESSAGAIWIGTHGGGLSVFESGTFTSYGTTGGLSSNTVYCFLESSTGAIWIGTEYGGMNVYESGRFIHYGTEEGLSTNTAYNLLESSTGAIWIGSYGGIDVLESGQIAHYGTEEGLSHNMAVRLLESSNGAIWVGTFGGGVNVFESGYFKQYGIEEGLSNANVLSLMESSDGAVWIGTFGGGVNFFESDRFTYYGTKEGLSNTKVSSLMESSDGAIWIGTYGGGVNVYESDHITHYGIEEGLDNFLIVSLMETSKGAIWVGTNMGLNVYESGHFRHYGIKNGLSSYAAQCLIETSTGAIWIGTLQGGLNVYENGRFTHYSTEEGLSDNAVRSLLESSTGAIWIGTYGGGVDVYDSEHFTHYGTSEGLSNNFVTSLLELSTGAIWIGTHGGVDIYDSGQFTHYGIEEGLADNIVTNLAMDSLGNVWAGTGKGLTRFVAIDDGYQLTTLDKFHGFISNGSILFTKTNQVSKKGTMWSGVGGALTAFKPPAADTLKPQMFLTGLAINQQQIQWRKLAEVTEKMPNVEGINPDTLFFPDPDSIILLSNIPPDTNRFTKIGIRWNGTEELLPYHLPIDLELPYDQNHLTFHYSGLKLSEQFDVVYRYLLEGMDNEWSPFTKEGKADYRNIPPGEYTFRVRSRGRNFLWSDEASINFTVHPPWWLAPWSKALWISMFLGAFLAVYKLRTRALKIQQKKLKEKVHEQTEHLIEANEELNAAYDQLKELDDYKDSMNSMIIHDFKNSLNTVINFSEESPTKRRLQSINQAGKFMLNMVLNMLDVQKFETTSVKLSTADCPVSKIVNKAIDQLSYLIDQKSIKLNFNQHAVLVSRVDQDLIIRCIVNILSNAIKFVPVNGQIDISVEQKEQNLFISIKDNGPGIPADKLDKVFDKFSQVHEKKSGSVRSTGIGLTFCKMVVEAHGGTIGVESTEGQGSDFFFTLPLISVDEYSKPLETVPAQQEQTIVLSDKHKADLSQLIDDLKKWEVYDYSEIMAILEKVEADSENINAWKEAMIKALHNGNEERYKELLSV